MLLVGLVEGGPKAAEPLLLPVPQRALSYTLTEAQAAASHTACEVLLRLSARSTHQHGVQAASACATQGRRPRARCTPGEAAALARLSAARARRPWVE